MWGLPVRYGGNSRDDFVFAGRYGPRKITLECGIAEDAHCSGSNDKMPTRRPKAPAYQGCG